MTSMQRGRKKPGRATTSCAECRRLKLRCDRKIPCDSCVKRGCGTICPTGSLIGGRGDRLILTSTAELHDKIDSMSTRIRVLEEALRRAHGKTSDDIHPLLSNPISPASQTCAEILSDSASVKTLSDSETDSVISALGTLSIGTRGESTFMNGTARTEYLMGHSLGRAHAWETLLQNSRLPSRLIEDCVLEHGFTPVDDELRQIVMDHRPPLVEAIRLCEIYLEWGETLWYPLGRHELLDELLGDVYRSNSYEELPAPHSLALLYSVFALASLFDYSRPAENIEAFDYHILSRVSLDISFPCTTATLQTVSVLAHNLRWLHICAIQTDPGRTYVLMGFTVRLAYQMGLHLHSASFRLEKGVVQKRSTVFWQLFLTDALLSLLVGRPPSFSLDWINVPYPEDQSPVENDMGEMELGWHSWMWRHGRLLHEAMATALSVKVPPYSAILELDRKIRDFPVPSRLQLHRVCDAQVGQQIVLQQLLVLMEKEQVLLNIHRRYFSQALQDLPDDLLKHKYGPSVIATYRSAWRLIVSLSSAVNWIPNIVARLSAFWSLAFSASIVMCMIVTYAPNSNMAASSLHEIDVVYEVFKKAAPTVKCASVLLKYVERVWHKSRENFYEPLSGYSLSKAELDRVGGGSTSLLSKINDIPLLSSRPHADSSTSAPASYATSGNVSNPPYIPNSSFDRFSSSIHPRIMQDMQRFVRPTVSSTGGFDYGTPEQFSQSMIDTQSSHCYLEPERVKAQHASNTFRVSLPEPSYLPGEPCSPEGTPLDSAWQNFMEQLGLQ